LGPRHQLRRQRRGDWRKWSSQASDRWPTAEIPARALVHFRRPVLAVDGPNGDVSQALHASQAMSKVNSMTVFDGLRQTLENGLHAAVHGLAGMKSELSHPSHIRRVRRSSRSPHLTTMRLSKLPLTPLASAVNLLVRLAPPSPLSIRMKPRNWFVAVHIKECSSPRPLGLTRCCDSTLFSRGKPG
jgi:hypothetical protein